MTPERRIIEVLLSIPSGPERLDMLTDALTAPEAPEGGVEGGGGGKVSEEYTLSNGEVVHVETCVESPWLQCLILNCDKLLSSLVFHVNCAHTEREDHSDRGQWRQGQRRRATRAGG